MPRLISPMGSVVNVSEEKAARLGSGWVPFEAPEQPKKRPGRPKKSADVPADSDED